MDETKTGSDALIEKIVEALNTETNPEWSPAPSWADYVLTWEGLRQLANDIMGRKPYDGRNSMAGPVTRGFLEAALNREGFITLPRDMTADGNKHYGPLCDGCRRDKMDASWHPLLRMRHAGRASELTGPVNCTVCGRRTPGLFRMYGHDEGVDTFEW